MFDPAILAALQTIPMPPEPPRVVEERTWLSAQGQQAQKRATRLADQYEAAADVWLAALNGLKVGFEAVPPGPASEPVLASMTEVIQELEATAERRARWRAKFAKKSKALIKQDFKLDPSVGAVNRDFALRLLAIDDRVIEAILDHALFMRAVWAERHPEARTGPTFEDPKELSKYLTTALAE